MEKSKALENFRKLIDFTRTWRGATNEPEMRVIFRFFFAIRENNKCAWVENLICNQINESTESRYRSQEKEKDEELKGTRKKEKSFLSLVESFYIFSSRNSIRKQ